MSACSDKSFQSVLKAHSVFFTLYTEKYARGGTCLATPPIKRFLLPGVIRGAEVSVYLRIN
jgi:hypothetical protein